MGAYRQGIIGGIPPEDAYKIKAQTAAAWEKANRELGADLKKAARTFPKAFTARRASELCAHVAYYGQNCLNKYGGMFSGTDTKALIEAINNLRQMERTWDAKVPVLASIRKNEGYVYKQNQNKEWQELYKAVMRMYAECAGVIGQKIVIEETRAEFRADLQDRAETAAEALTISGGVVLAGVALAALVMMKK